VKGDGDGVRDSKGAKGPGFRSQLLERPLHDFRQLRSKRETNDHRCDESDRNLYDRPAQVFQVLKERLGRLRLRHFPKLENVF
jgi:hypothetical protein